MELVELFKKRKQQPKKAKNLLKIRRKGAAFVKTLTNGKVTYVTSFIRYHTRNLLGPMNIYMYVL